MVKRRKKVIISLIVIILIIGIVFFAFSFSGNKNPKVEMNTTKGVIIIELYSDKAPETVENFLSYVNSGFYNGLVFHRVIGGFMIQTGGFDESGNQKNTNEPIKLESKNGLKNNISYVAMARTIVPNSATSQFFINSADNEFLNYGVRNEGYAVFGKVIEGMEVVKEIENSQITTKLGMENWPIENIQIISMRIL